MRSFEDTAARQLEALSNFLAFTPRDPSLSLSQQIARDAAGGDVWARRVMHSRILESPQSTETAASVEEPAGKPLPSIAVAAQPETARKQVRNAAQGVVNRRVRLASGAGRRCTAQWHLATSIGS
jgi:hypothetical protein